VRGFIRRKVKFEASDGSSSRSRRNPPNWKWFVVGALGLPILFISFLLRDGAAEDNSWWSNALISIGATWLLLVPGAWLGNMLKKVEQRASAAETEVNMLTAAETVRSNHAGEQLAGRQFDRAAAENAPYLDLAATGDRASLVAALTRARESGIVTNTGVRASIEFTALHYRFNLNEEKVLVVTIEQDDGSVVADHIWPADVDAGKIYSELQQSVENVGGYLGPGTFDPSVTLKTLGHSLEYAATLASEKLRLGSDYARDIIEFVGGWYITRLGVFPKGHEYYLIRAERLWEPGWEEQISWKPWEGNFAEALKVARALHQDKRGKVSAVAERPHK
jgi:hypothetical protein